MLGTKLRLWLRSWSSSLSALTRKTHRSFHHCMIFLCANELKLTDNVKCDIAKHRVSWVHNYFPKTDGTNNWIHYPFHALPPVHLPISEQESLIGIATSCSVKIELPYFWIEPSSVYPALANCAVKTLMPFATMYLCESGLSALTGMKTKYRHRLCVENDLRLRLSPIQPNIAVMSHPSH